MNSSTQTEGRWAGRMIIAAAAVGIAVMVKQEVAPYVTRARWARADQRKRQQEAREAAERESTVYDFSEYMAETDQVFAKYDDPLDEAEGPVFIPHVPTIPKPVAPSSVAAAKPKTKVLDDDEPPTFDEPYVAPPLFINDTTSNGDK